MTPSRPPTSEHPSNPRRPRAPGWRSTPERPSARGEPVSRRHRASIAAYRVLLMLLPRAFRTEYGPPMVQAFSDLLIAERRRGGLSGALGVWRRALLQTLSSAVGERFRGGRDGPGGPGEHGGDRAGWFDGLRSAFRQAGRSIAARPGFGVTVVLVLGIGIGATTSIFTAVNGVILSELPYPEIDRLVYFEQASHSPDEFLAWREIDAFEEIAALQSRRRDVVTEAGPARVRVIEVTPSYFPLLGVQSQLGRMLSDADVSVGAQVVLLSHTYWIERLGGDPSVVGRALQLDDEPYTIVGVAAPFTPPTRVNQGRPDLWTPLQVEPRGRGNLRVFARLRPGVTAAAAQERVKTVTDGLVEAYPEDYAYLGGVRRVPLVSIRAAEIVSVEQPIYMVLAAVGLMLMIALTTVANLFLAHTRDRRHEIAVRTALGASRGTVAAQLLAESVTLASLGGALGLVLAHFGVRGLVAILPPDMPRIETIQIDVAVLGFVIVLSVVSGVAFGVAPLLFTRRLEHGAARAADTEGSGSRRAWIRLRGLMVSAQIALAVVLLVGSGLLFNSFVRLLRVDPGFEPAGVVAAELAIGRRYRSAEERVRLAQELERRLEATPGVTSAAYGLLAPFSRETGCCWWGPATTPGSPDTVRVHLHLASPGYMRTLGIPIVRGADLPPRDAAPGDAVPVIVGTSLERRMFDGESALGRVLSIGNGAADRARVVGVIEDPKYGALDYQGEPQVYLPYATAARLHGSLTVIARTAGSGGAGDVVRSAVWGADPALPVPSVLALDAQVDRSLTGQKLLSGFLLGFAAFALTLALVGTYGTMRYAVGRRRRELGIRLVLGATPRSLVSHVMGSGARIVTLGVVVGLAGASIVGALIGSVFFGITPWDPATYASVTALIVAAALSACYLPARRASRVDPLETMRTE